MKILGQAVMTLPYVGISLLMAKLGTFTFDQWMLIFILSWVMGDSFNAKGKNQNGS
jgi:hypothetical protein